MEQPLKNYTVWHTKNTIDKFKKGSLKIVQGTHRNVGKRKTEKLKTERTKRK